MLVEELKASAEDALSRGFAILTCEPHDKAPWAPYAPHGWQSATRNPEIALKPWKDGKEANYGVACGPSNITVIDCDHGLTTLEEFEEWRKANGLPETFTVLSGRDGELGIHMYYTGAVATCAFKLGKVTGELKGLGGYVVGPGSVHPSGKKYTILHDSALAALPDGLVALAKNKEKGHLDFVPGKGDLIPAGSRWAHLQSKAGFFKNAGLDEEGIYLALRNFCTNNCEDGANYPDDKIRNLAEWASSDKCEAEQSGLVTVGSPDPDIEASTPELPLTAIDGDYIGDLALAVTDGTFIPPSFARATIKTMLGCIIDGKIGFPGEENLHLRNWNALISARPGMGKSVTWERCSALLAPLMNAHGVIFPPAGFFSSGEHAIKVLAENDNTSQLVYFDEMKTLFDKGNNTGSTLFSKLLELYEGKKGGIGAIGTGKAQFSNVGLNMTGGFTREGFDRSVSGKGAGGSGFLSRMVIDYSNGLEYEGDWDQMDSAKVNAAIAKITEAIKFITDKYADNKNAPFIPEEDDDAKVARYGFFKWLAGEKKRIQQENPDASYAARLDAHFKRDLLMRVAFSDEKRITKTLVEKSTIWAQHQLMLRETLWPIDNGGAIEKFERRILQAIRKVGPLTKAGVQKYSNADKCEGGYEAWNRAWANLLKADKIIQLVFKSNRGKEKYGFDNAIWKKDAKMWVFGD